MGTQTMRVEPAQPWHEREMGYHLGVGERAGLNHKTPLQRLRTCHVAGCMGQKIVTSRMPGRTVQLASSEPPGPGPRCPRHDLSLLSRPGGVRVIRSVCLLLRCASPNLSS